MNSDAWYWAALTIAGIIYFAFRLARAIDSCSWPSVKGRIVRSGFQKNDDDEGCGLVVDYEYIVDGQLQKAANVAYNVSSNGSKCYAPGDLVEVRYDPAKPSRATLKTHGYVGFLVGLIVVCLVGPLLVFVTCDPGHQFLEQHGIHINVGADE